MDLRYPLSATCKSRFSAFNYNSHGLAHSYWTESDLRRQSSYRYRAPEFDRWKRSVVPAISQRPFNFGACKLHLKERGRWQLVSAKDLNNACTAIVWKYLNIYYRNFSRVCCTYVRTYIYSRTFAVESFYVCCTGWAESLFPSIFFF